MSCFETSQRIINRTKRNGNDLHFQSLDNRSWSVILAGPTGINCIGFNVGTAVVSQKRDVC